MQCHKCGLNGKGDSRCIACKSAEYLGNGWMTMVHSDTIEDVIDVYGVHRDNTTPPSYIDELKEDCKKVVSVLRECKAQSLPYALQVFLLFASLSPSQFKLVDAVLNSRTLKDVAEENCVSKQAVQQQWSRMAKKNKLLKGVLKNGRDR